eukprot:GDKI01032287.1.p2 GENE.GDKI01032287.1~~GDKI01032287.1.p2  ORF type:complete len:161 (-),score=71.46 GDKI01032287.1:209-691(-)
MEMGGEEEDVQLEEESESSDEDVEDYLGDQQMGTGLAGALAYLKNRGVLDEDAVRIRRTNKGVKPLHQTLEDEEVRIEYKDQFGRVMNQKEAFKQISWTFHGKKPGKKKQEKYLRKVELEKRMTAGIDAAPASMRALQAVQQEERKAHMVLTGNTVSSKR